MFILSIDTCTLTLNALLQLSLERDEHKLVIEQLSTLESERKAFRLIGGILVEKTVGEALPAVQQNYEGVCNPSKCPF